jgi:hypothetical protein
VKRAATFETTWRRVELGWTVAEVAAGAPAGLAAELEMADALRELGGSIEAPATAGAWAALQDKLDVDVRVRRTRPGAPARAARAFLAVAAAFTLLVAASLRAEPGSPLYGLRRGAEQAVVALSPNDGSLHLRLASARLGDLLDSLRTGDYGQAPAVAGSLASERTAAVSDGADVSALDARIRVEVPAALIAAPLEVARAVEDELSDPLGGSSDHANGAGFGASGHGGTGNGGTRGGSSAGPDQGSGGGSGTSGSGDGSQGSGTQGTQGGSGDGSQGDQGGSGSDSQGSGSQGDQGGSGDGSQGSGTRASSGGSSSPVGSGRPSDSQS